MQIIQSVGQALCYTPFSQSIWIFLLGLGVLINIIKKLSFIENKKQWIMVAAPSNFRGNLKILD